MTLWVVDALHLSVTMASPLYLIVPGNQLFPKQHFLRHKTLSLRLPPLDPASFLVAAPVAGLWLLKPSSHCWNDCNDSVFFLLVHSDSPHCT